MKKILATSLILAFTGVWGVEPFTDTGVDVKVGTLGVGIDISKSIYDDYLVGRFNANYGALTINSNQLSYKLALQTYGLLLDYHPLQNNFRVSGGLYYNGSSFANTSGSSVTATFNGATYQVNNYNASANFPSIQPYVGVGYGYGAVQNYDSKGLYFTADLGFLIGAPTFNASGTCVGSNCATFQSNLQQAINQTQSTFNTWGTLYPVLDVGIGYRF